jgi:hypothetical protein
VAREAGGGMIAALGYIGLAIILAGVAISPVVYGLLRDLYDEDEW